MQRQEIPAVLSVIAGATIWGLVWYPLNILQELGVTGLWTTFLVFSLISIASLPFLLHSRLKKGWTFVPGPALLLVVFGGLTNLLFFLALTETTVVRAIMLFYLSPVWNLLLGRFTKGYALSWQKFFVIFLSLTGAAVLLGLHRGGEIPWNRGDTFALLSGLCFAISVVGLQLSPHTPSWALTVIHWFGAALTALLGILLLAPTPPPWAEITTWLPVLSGFAFGMQATASLCILFSLTRLESYRVNMYMLLEIIVGSVSYALWSMKVIELHEWLGICIILLGALLDNIFQQRRRVRQL